MSKNLELLQHAQRITQRRLRDWRSQNGFRQVRRPTENISRQPEFLLTAWLVVKTHWRLALSFALLVIAAVTAVVFSLPPVYEPSARIELETGPSVLSSSSEDTRLSTAQYAETQARNLQSSELHLEVIRKLGLDRNRQWLGATGRGKVIAKLASTTETLTPSEYAALALFDRSLNVKHDNTSWLIDVSFAARDPKLAALVTNNVIEQFIDRDYRSRAQAIRESTDFLSQQLNDLRQQMDASNRALTDFQKSSGITPVTDSRSSFDERAGELNRQLTLARVERIQLESLLAQGRSNPYLLAQVSADPAIQDLSKQLSTVRAQQKEALVVYGENHPKAKQLAAQIEQLEKELTSQRSRILANIENSFSAAHTRERLLDTQVRNASKQMGVVEKYEALKKESQANEELYKSLYGKLKEIAILGEAAPRNVRWIDHAQVLDRPTRPRRLLDIAAGTAAGLFGGILLAFVRESVNTKLRTLEDVKGWMEPASVSLVPLIATPGFSLRHKGGRQVSREPFVLDRPNSPESEALRGLVTSIAPWHGPSSPRVLLVASSQAGEGKTTIAVNLAIALARSEKTCLVDADLRNPVLGTTLKIQHSCGLAELLAHDCDLDEALVGVKGVTNLTLLLGGSVDLRSGDLITGERFEGVLDALREKFQYVIVDSPPILPYADSRVIARLGDGIVLVARAGTTTREAFKRSLEILESVHAAPVLEVVLNAVPHHSPDYRYYKHAS
jgi:capsular exopolysaccharide synthesis family protein